MSWMLQPETQPWLVMNDDWPIFSGLLLTGVITVLTSFAGLKSFWTLPVNWIGAASAVDGRSPTRTRNAKLHGYKRRGTMTSLLPRMVSSSRGSRSGRDAYIVSRDDLSRNSGDQRVASERHAATRSS